MTSAFRRLAILSLFLLCLAGWRAPLAAHASAFDPGGEQRAEHVEQEPAHFLLFKAINFLILVVGLGYLLRKPLREFFAGRSASIRRHLEEGRKALEASQAQLQKVEEKLRHLEEEIAAFKALAAQDMEAERERMRQAAAEEAEKILQSSRAQIDSAVRAAKLDLKAYTAQQAIGHAEELIRRRLDDAGRKRLVSQFVARLEERGRRN
jgi:F-type H+-transporting ATPase subunit b